MKSTLQYFVAGALALAGSAASAQGLPTQTWAPGTQLAMWNHGGRITTFHRGYLYLGGLENQGTWTYDISNPINPQLRRTQASGVNGHTWAKVGDVFWRTYWIPEIGDNNPSPFQNLSNPLSPTQQTQNVGTFPSGQPPMGWPGNWLNTYPHFFGEYVVDARVGWWPHVSEANVLQMSGLTSANHWRIGNLLFLTPSDTQNGLAVFDIGNPAQPVMLDLLSGNYKQYTNAWQVWRHYLLLMFGDNTNGPQQDANTLVIDFSDPTNLQLVHKIPYNDLPGRYAHFQDDYAFAGRFDRGTKYNLVTRQVEQVFTPTSCCFGDFQWIPLGHIVLASSSETTGSRSYLFSHRATLDTTRPTVGYHLPRPNAINQPVTTVIGLVINETLDSPTVTSQNIQVRAVGGATLSTTVIHTNYGVVNIVPEAPLAANTTYEVRIVQDGVRDVAGNGMAEYTFRFATGPTLVPADLIFANGFQP
ncbi:Ig-like domain-containing protein [Tahibacter amnicola]|uniref:Ig-like domain-containing protein n=1 Tax=Tahibacter amnicola TaxID=2976241 RepID=A0ABY6BL41_9GAMM|nr:Ig-like domain-containing protein [Tahibacter amnicola]UXI70192.1 Ig-like domain-containing protein [Tahibacter amnicola]